MELSSMSYSYNPHNNPARKKVFIREEIELCERADSEISPCWKIITVLSYFCIVISGMATSIAIGSLLAAFNNNCVLYARLTVRGLDEIVLGGGNLTLYDDNIVIEQYGSLYDCTFSEFCSVASAIFGGVWGIMFLQCGKGGITKRSASQSWSIVPPALLTNVIFFILSCITFAKTTGGLSYFCNHLRSESTTGELATNVTKCKDILAFHFPTDNYNTNLYHNYILAQVASIVTFLGWLVTLFVLILRCFIPVDFTVYGRRLYEIHNVSADEKRRAFAQNSRCSIDDNFPSTSTSHEIIGNGNDSSIATTSFSLQKSERSKKLS